MSSHQTVMWIDHHEARIIRVEAGTFDESVVRAPHQHVHRHPKGLAADHNHPDDIHRFFHDVARALEGADSILIVGPSTAKLQFLRYVHKQAHPLEPKIVGIETVDHPTDAQIMAYAKHYFGIPDRVGQGEPHRG
jgi:stalled ribosome rescue protein Dom34